MKNLIKYFTVLVLIVSLKPAMAQTGNADFKGAVATKANYKALYFVDEADPKKIKMTLRNINNAVEDPRLKGKVTIELVAFADGVDMFKKESPYQETLLALQKKGVILAQCENTVRERNIDKATLFDFIGYVPSGNGEIILRGGEGWTIVHP
ncbi:DsrE family protein [Mucilaginibacter sp. UR6-11]|uniref:DsrE family protein n=1 Tax=Mucilaginibacter sp. UR6-11 TaxID=1435644 RepID=UPI001E2AD21D|nr:DsrE family protein [Mucilaginibacter sp. UR6-11]MCC8423465.1 DsrE family protein [Mucilaginibacter sp. UR6-11]